MKARPIESSWNISFPLPSRPLLQRVGLNTLWLFLARIFSQALMIVFTALIARRLGAAGLGQFAFIASAVYLGNMFTTFGMDTLLIREVARTHNPATPLIPAAFRIQIVFSAILVAAVFVGADTAGNSAETLLALKLYSLALFPLAFFTLFSAVLRAYERMDVFLVLSIASALLQTAGALIVFATGAGLTTLIYFLLAAQTAAAFLSAVLCYSYIPGFAFLWRIQRGELTSIARRAAPFAALVALGVLYQRIGVLILPALAGDATTGWFSAAARIVESMKIAPQALLGALFPVLAHRLHRGQESRLARSALRISLGLGALAALVVSVTAQPLTDLIYGSGFAASITALQVLAWALIPYAFTANVALELVARGREGSVLKGNLIGVLFALVLFLILVPAYGLLGASWAVVGSEWVQAGIFYFIRRASA
ncbi:MAG: flippase [Chloroflexota bacterium]|nr:flippase [Chloroflexota bacterium]